MSRRTILTETAIPKLFCHTFNAVSLQTINLFTTLLVLAREVMIALLIFFIESFDIKSCFVVFFHDEQFNFSSLNLNLECNFFKYGGK